MLYSTLMLMMSSAFLMLRLTPGFRLDHGMSIDTGRKLLL